MAKKISDEIIKLNIIVNGNEAQKEILDLEKANKNLIESKKELINQEKKALEAYNKTRKENEAQRRELNQLQNQLEKVSERHTAASTKLKLIEEQSGKTSKEYKKQESIVKSLEGQYGKLWSAVDKSATKLVQSGTEFKKANEEMVAVKTSIAKVTNEIDANTEKIKELYSSLTLTDMSMAQLQKRAIMLKTALRNMAPDDTEFEKLSADLNAVKTRLAELGGTLKLTDLSLSDLAVRATQLEDALKLDLPEEKLASYRVELSKVMERMSELDGTMDINKMSVVQLEAEISRLNEKFKSAKPNSDDFQEYSTKVKAAELRLAELKGTLKLTDMTMVQLEAEALRLAHAMEAVPKSGNEYLKLEADLGKVQSRIAELNHNFKILEMSGDELKNRAKLLQSALDSVRGNPEKVAAYKKELEEVNTRIAELSENGKKAKWSVGNLADAFNRYAALAASFVAALTGVVLSIQKVIDFNGKLSDKMADVQKTTGMTKREVDELAKSFGLLHTRTSRMELLGIAEVGGKLGIAKEEIGDFVRVMNKAGVALGDSFQGGPEVVADKLGKIKGLYAELRNSGVEAAFESVGSAINDLGADGTASEQNLAEFAQRVGTMPESMKPTIQEALGLGAAFEESGLMAEKAGNNYGKLIAIAARDVDKFAKVMQRPAAELKELINNNPTEFFLQFAASLKGLNGTDTSKILDFLKLNDREVSDVISAATQNVGLFRDKIELATQSMADASSLTTEYDIKNKTLGATLDRLKKVVNGWFTSDGMVAFLDSAVTWLAKFVGAVEDSENSTTGWRNTIVFMAKIVAILTSGLFSYVTATKLVSLWTNRATTAMTLHNVALKAHTFLLSLEKAARMVQITLMEALGIQATKATARLATLNRVVALNPWGAVLAVLAAVTTAFIAFRKSNADAEATIKKTNGALETNIEYKKQLSRATTDLKTKIDPLVSVLKSEETSLETRKRAYEALIKIAPEFEGTLDKEYRATEKLAGIYEKLLKNLEAVALAKARTSVREQMAEAVADAESKEYDAYLKKLQEDARNTQIEKRNKYKEKNAITGGGGSAGGFGGTTYATMESQSHEAADEYKKAMAASNVARQNMENYTDYLENIVEDLEKRLKKVKEGSEEAKKIQAEIDTILGISATTTHDNKPHATTPEDQDAKKAARERKFRLDAINKAREDSIKAAQDSLDLERQLTDSRLALLMEGFDKEEAMENENHKRKLQDLQKMLVSEVEFAKLEESINDPTLPAKQRGALVHIRESWLEKNKHINGLIEVETGRHQIAIATIEEKTETKRIQDLSDKYALEAEQRETAHLNELAALGTNEAAKEKLQRKFEKEELANQMDYLEQIIAEKQKVLNGENREIDLSLFTPDQIKAMEAEISKLKKQLAELGIEKAKLQGGANFWSSAGSLFGNTDILGFSADQWKEVFNNLDTVQNKMMAASMVITSLQNMWGMYNDFQAANDQAQLRKYEKNQDSRKKKLKWQLDNGYINQAQYTRALEQMDADLDKKKAEIEYKAAKRQRALSIAQAISGTATAVIGALGNRPWTPANFALAAIVGAMGALQLGTILKTPLPAKGYEKGLYPEYVKREQDGKTFRAGYGGKTRSGMVNKPTYFLAGENGPEMVIDNAAYRQLSPDTKEMLIRELQGIKGFEHGYYNNDVTGGGGRIQVPVGNSGQNNEQLLSMVLQAMDRYTMVMERLEQTGIIAYISRDPKEIKELLKDMDKIKDSRKKAQV